VASRPARLNVDTLEIMPDPGDHGSLPGLGPARDQTTRLI
jgi:hypothetical protein